MLAVALALGCGAGACTLFVDTSGLGGPATEGDASSLVDEGGGTDAGDGDAPFEASTDAPRRDLYFDEVVSDGPVAYFRLSDATPEAKNEIAGSAIGAIYPASGATRAAPGALAGSADGALRFDALDARLALSGPVDFLGDVPFTVEAWVKLDDFSGTDIAEDMLFPGGGGGRTGWTLFLRPEGAQFQLRTEMWTDGVIFLYTQHLNPVSTSSFHHVVVFHSDVDHLDHLVVDGITSAGGFTGNGVGERVANGTTLSWGGFRGTLDELAIYDKVLPQERVLKHLSSR
ncbi:MAG: hypothetical protein KF782_09055 [Labilithrix sp.]|nr:hypothetical protein [Labilithrix sp.]